MAELMIYLAWLFKVLLGIFGIVVLAIFIFAAIAFLIVVIQTTFYVVRNNTRKHKNTNDIRFDYDKSKGNYGYEYKRDDSNDA